MASSLPVTTAPVLPPLDLDVALLTAELLDIHSVSDHETPLADAVEEALRALPALRVQRIGDAVVARTEFGLDSRVVLAGHLDTVPLPTVPGARGTVPSRWEPESGVGTTSQPLAVKCNKGFAPSIALGQGQNFSGTRRMSNGTDQLGYTLQLRSGSTTGETVTTSAAGASGDIAVSVEGTIPASQWVSEGAYGDVVTMTVTF